MTSPSRSERLLPLIWSGAIEDPSGYADEARAYLLALEAEGIGIALRDLRWTPMRAGLPPRQAEAIARARARTAEPWFVTVYHLVPGVKLIGQGTGPTVMRTMFETDSLPPSWLPRLAEADEIWVPCTFNRESFARGGVAPEKLHVLPETLDFELFAPTAHEHLAGPFSFLTNFDFTDRKGWEILLDAWAEAFTPDDDVKLVLKCISMHGFSPADIAARVERHLNGRRTAPLELNTELLPLQELSHLYASSDAFVLASRGEGWGRPYMEAMAMGLPTIGSRWSGNLDFMHDGNSWLVDGAVVPVPAGAQEHTPLYVGQRWFEPDPDALVAAMRTVAAGGADVERRAAAARPELIERFGAAPTAARLVELTEGALARWRERQARPLRCCFRGDWGSIHSLAVVNEALTGALETSAGTAVTRRGIDGDPLRGRVIGIAQQWPPVFEAPSEGPFVLYQPWEFGEIPAAWVEPIRTSVDEVWTPSEYARRAFLAAGVDPELVHVVPNGVDLDHFRPDGPAAVLPDLRGTVFLFVGGTTYRKGIDLLLQAYGRAFSDTDDVTLVVKGFGATTLYRGQTGEKLIEEFSALPGAPHVVLLEQELSFTELPALYRAADCLVQPYRGEGFCLPALEALACGLPVIVTGGGPTDDFTSPACAWQLPAHTIPLPPEALPARHTPRGGGFMLEPDLDALAEALREAADPAERATRAAHARSHAERFSWQHAAAIASARLRELGTRTPIRFVEPATLRERRGLLLAVDADWNVPDSWAPAVRAFAHAFAADAEVTLLLAGSGTAAGALVERELAAAGPDGEDIADLVLADLSHLDPNSLALAADAFVCSDGRRPARARRVVAPEPDALRTLLPTR
jgi:glycosyltransferase involved in cell wall biosynthesis